ncbi:MAG: cellulase family glycosylhydrolase, partial [Kiritimatiellaeota bacterium]|nr:cellulase family glycosylhydrolase [Kiritimatiellota bacterium]
MNTRWTPERANDWHNQLPWLVGCNYTPRTAVNQLEMWQADTFDPATIDQELGWASAIGFNCLRVYLHDLPWFDDRDGFIVRLARFLDIAGQHRLLTLFVLFDSCWQPRPKSGPQPAPTPGVHNSQWVQSPGIEVLADPAAFARREEYVTGLVSRFRADPRILGWDVWNEPDNLNTSSIGANDLASKSEIIAPYLGRAFAWARAADPSQPLTCGVWNGDWSTDAALKPHERVQLDNSDVVSFHCYGPPDDMAARVAHLQRCGRPLLCTEYMARGSGSTFESILPVLKPSRVGAFNWGFAQGKIQTHLSWESWQKPVLDNEPPLWFHDVLRPDGAPYSQA